MKVGYAEQTDFNEGKKVTFILEEDAIIDFHANQK